MFDFSKQKNNINMFNTSKFLVIFYYHQLCFSNQVIEIVFNVMYVFILLILKQTPNENKPDGCTVTTAVNKSVFLKEALSTVPKEGTQPAFSSSQR